jgi:hypothetical protein
VPDVVGLTREIHRRPASGQSVSLSSAVLRRSWSGLELTRRLRFASDALITKRHTVRYARAGPSMNGRRDNAMARRCRCGAES